MKPTLLLLALFVAASAGLQAQTAPAVKVDFKSPKLSVIQTPIVIPNNVPDKNWRPKSWLELDMEFDIKLPAAAGGRNGSLSAMTVNYYLATSASTTDGKQRQVLKGTFNYVDIPASEKCHALAFATPATMRRVLGKDTFTSSDIVGWGVEIVVEGQVVAGDSSAGGKWWESGDKFSIIENALVPKVETPFSILWGDYDVRTKTR